MRYHKSSLGSRGEGLPTDDEGYAYTTVREYMEHCGMTRKDAEWAVETQQAVCDSVREWQDRYA